MASPRSTIRGTNLNFDPEFRFLLVLDPALEGWRALAAEWWLTQKATRNRATAVVTFFVRYLHALQLDTRPITLFEAGSGLPDLWKTLNQVPLQEASQKIQYDTISDFLDWVLRTELAEPDSEGYRVVPTHLKHPFPRIRLKQVGKISDLSFTYVTERDPRMGHWQALAAEWLGAQKTAVHLRRNALDCFLIDYLVGCELPHHPIEFLKRSTPKPNFSEVLVKRKTYGAVGQLAAGEIKHNNYAADFLDWVLVEKLSIDDEYGHRAILPNLHNPIARLSTSGLATPTETVKAALSIRYIKELRMLLAEGPNFRDWGWAQQVTDGGTSGGDWFVVDPKLINRNDPDCVWRERNSTLYEQKNSSCRLV
ncbi:VPA1269 family protein [Uliginosibacterium gangwonense]|uniref:VPA1269 family protein n=1 Tax=Uliginosibacterium gangwonense TaxID=392736 RepID=UPI000399A895|nr:VPA1269 family protein [Uliginosibacterium gangwonense]